MIMNGRIPTTKELESIRNTLSQEPPEEEADTSLNQLIQTLGSLDDMASALDTRLDGVLSSLDDILKGLGSWDDNSVREERNGEREETDDAPPASPPTESSVEVIQEAEQSNRPVAKLEDELADINNTAAKTVMVEKFEVETNSNSGDDMPLQLSDAVPGQGPLLSDTLPNHANEKNQEA